MYVGVELIIQRRESFFKARVQIFSFANTNINWLIIYLLALLNCNGQYWTHGQWLIMWAKVNIIWDICFPLWLWPLKKLLHCFCSYLICCLSIYNLWDYVWSVVLGINHSSFKTSRTFPKHLYSMIQFHLYYQ